MVLREFACYYIHWIIFLVLESSLLLNIRPSFQIDPYILSLKCNLIHTYID